MNSELINTKKGGREGKLNFLSMITVSPTRAPMLSEAEWRAVLGEWIRLRETGLGSVGAATQLGHRVSVLEKRAKAYGVVIPESVKRKLVMSPTYLKKREAYAAQYEDFCGLVEGGMKVMKAAAEVGADIKEMMRYAKSMGVEFKKRVEENLK